MNKKSNTNFLCGMVREVSVNYVKIKSGHGLHICPGDPGLSRVVKGRRRMIVVSDDGVILAVYGRPRIRLIRLLEKGTPITEDLLEVYHPMYIAPWFKFPNSSV